MSHLIPCFFETDLLLAQQVLAAEPDGRVVVVCPHMQERALAQGLPAELVHGVASAGTLHQAQVVRAAALGLQQALDPLLATIDPYAPGCGWLLQPFQALFRMALGVASLWRRVVESMPAVCWHVPFCDSPFAPGQRSFLPALLLVERLQAADKRFRVLGQRPAEPADTALPDLTDPALGQPDMLVHGEPSPADLGILLTALQASQRSVIGIGGPAASANWRGEGSLNWLRTVSLAEQQARLPEEVLRRLDDALKPAVGCIDQHLAAYFASPKFRQRQAVALAATLRRQLVFSVALQQAWAARRAPSTLLLWSPDPTLTGPLLSQARRQRLRVRWVGEAQGWPRPVASPLAAEGADLQLLAHPLQGSPTVDAQGHAVPTQVLALPHPVHWGGAPVQPLRRLGVLLESLSDEGLVHTDVACWLKGLKDLNEWCQAQEVVLHIRARPDAPVDQMLCNALGWPAERLAADQSGHSLTEFLAGCDACVAYGQASPAVAEAFRLGVPAWQVHLPLVRPVATQGWHTGVVPSVSMPELLDICQRLRADPLQLWTAARDQHQAYLRQQAGALPLDALL